VLVRLMAVVPQDATRGDLIIIAGVALTLAGLG
jgi:hypothetical protein